MSTISKAICWALAIVLTALAGAVGLITEDSARTMLIVLPVLAMTSLTGRSDCLARMRSRS